MSSLLEALLLGMLVGAFVCLFYSWSEWPGQLRSVRLFGWRRALVSIGLFLVTVQAILLVALWSPIIRHPALLLKCMYADFALLLVAVLCILIWRGTARWCLLASTVFLPVARFFTVLAELAY